MIARLKPEVFLVELPPAVALARLQLALGKAGFDRDGM